MTYRKGVGCALARAAVQRSAVCDDLATTPPHYFKNLDLSSAVVKRSRGVSGRLNGGVGHLLKKNKVQVIWGEAKITRSGEVVVAKSSKPPMQPAHPDPKGTAGPGTYKAKHIIIATGARPRALPGLEPDGKLVWTYFEAMVPPEMPGKMLVVGSGAIGIEFASFFNAMGVM